MFISACWPTSSSSTKTAGARACTSESVSGRRNNRFGILSAFGGRLAFYGIDNIEPYRQAATRGLTAGGLLAANDCPRRSWQKPRGNEGRAGSPRSAALCSAGEHLARLILRAVNLFRQGIGALAAIVQRSACAQLFSRA